MTMTKKQRDAAVLAAAERGYEPHQVGAPIPNPLRKAGRPSLSPEGGTSKALTARIPSDLHRRVVAFARTTGRSVSDLTRDALTAFIGPDSEPRRRKA
jgi:hypothetical protein